MRSAWGRTIVFVVVFLSVSALGVRSAQAQLKMCVCRCHFKDVNNQPWITPYYMGCVAKDSDCGCPASNCAKSLEDDNACAQLHFYKDPTLSDCAPKSPAPLKDGVYVFASKRDGQCLDLASGSNEKIQHAGCNGGSQQRWQLSRKEDGCYEFRLQNTDRCLDMREQSVNEWGGVIQANGCNQLSQQRWMIVPLGGPYFRFVSKRNGLCADVRDQEADPIGGRVQSMICNDSPNQQWTK